MRRRSAPLVVQAMERQRINLPPSLDTARVRERLCAAAEAAGMPEALERRRLGLFAKDAVGVVDIGEVAVEIFPKIRGGATPEEGRAFLVELLRFVGRDRGRFAAAAANIRDGGGSLVEVLYAWAMRAAALNVDLGLPRRYVARTEHSTAVRGRIDMKHVALARPGRDFELLIRHAPLSPNNEVAQAVRWIVREVASRTGRPDTRRLGLTLLADLQDVVDVDADSALFDRIALRPMEEYWEPLLAFGRSLVRQRRLDPAAAGSQPSVAVLFTLHDLFERALRRVLLEQGPAAGLHPGRIPRHLLVSDAGAELVKLKPDFVVRFVETTGSGFAVGDAKWKDIWTSRGTPEPGRADAYQLAAYMTAGNLQRGFLVAPLVGNSGGSPLQVYRHRMTGGPATIDVFGVHVATMLRQDAAGTELRQKLCAELASRIRTSPSASTEPQPGAAA